MAENKKYVELIWNGKYERYEKGEHQVMVKVVDVFGNDTNKVLKVKVK